MDMRPDYLALIVLFVSIMQVRTKAHRLPPIDWEPQKMDPLYTPFSAYFDNNLKNDFPSWEKDYLYMLIVSANLSYKQFSRLFPDESIILREISEEIVNRFNLITCTFILNSEKFINNLFFHLQPAYFRLRHGIPIINPMLHSIKEDYGYFFPIVSTVLKPFAEYVNRPIPEDELAHVVIILLSMVENIEEKKRTPHRGAIVCQHGIASSAMLKKRLQKVFVDIEFESYFSVDDFINSSLALYDIVFTTVDLPKKPDIPIFKSSPFMSEAELQNLWGEVYGIASRTKTNALSVSSVVSIVEKYCTVNNRFALETALVKIFSPNINQQIEGNQPMLRELLTHETIRFAKETENWESAISLCGAPLIEKGYISEGYVTACIDAVRNLGPYIVIVPLVAMPHAQAPEHVNQLSMSYLKLGTPVDVLDNSERSAQVFIMLAAEDKTKHMSAMAALGNILGDETNLERMICAESVEDVLNIINDADM